MRYVVGLKSTIEGIVFLLLIGIVQTILNKENLIEICSTWAVIISFALVFSVFFYGIIIIDKESLTVRRLLLFKKVVINLSVLKSVIIRNSGTTPLTTLEMNADKEFKIGIFLLKSERKKLVQLLHSLDIDSQIF